MSVIEEVKKVTLTLRKDRSTLGGTMQFHLSELSQIGKNAGNRDTTDDEAVQYLKKSVQKLKENPYSDKNEIAILEKFLPKMASDEEIISLFESIDVSSMNKGQIMGAAKKQFGTLVDMKRVGEILKDKYGL